MSLQIEEPPKHPNKTSHKKNNFSLFALGFRPFFFFAALFSIFIISLSVIQFSNTLQLSNYYSVIGWHAHEMLFGYSVAVIAGFLLTAVGNWTNHKMINGWQLVLLSLVFLLGRVSVFIPSLPPTLIALIDLSFIPLVVLIISIPIVRAKQWSNLIFIPLLLAMAAANLLVHLSALNLLNIPVVLGSQIMLYLVIFIIVIMGGRVIPFFTEKGVSGISTKKWPWVERLSPISILILLIVDVYYSNQTLTAYAALFAVVIHGIRLAGWYTNKIWQVPLVWILHLAYGWFIIGFLLQSFSLFNFTGSALSYHAFTAGGIGVMTLGMMVRVSIGHTGREMKLNTAMFLSFILINIAVLIRVILPLIFPENYLMFIQIAGWTWAAAFIIFAILFTPIWCRPRIDGREG